MSMIMVKQQHLHTYKQKLFSPLHNNIFNQRSSSNSCLNDAIFGLHKKKKFYKYNEDCRWQKYMHMIYENLVLKSHSVHLYQHFNTILPDGSKRKRGLLNDVIKMTATIVFEISGRSKDSGKNLRLVDCNKRRKNWRKIVAALAFQESDCFFRRLLQNQFQYYTTTTTS